MGSGYCVVQGLPEPVHPRGLPTSLDFILFAAHQKMDETALECQSIDMSTLSSELSPRARKGLAEASPLETSNLIVSSISY